MGSTGRRVVVRSNRGEEPEDKRRGRMWEEGDTRQRDRARCCRSSLLLIAAVVETSHVCRCVSLKCCFYPSENKTVA